MSDKQQSTDVYLKLSQTSNICGGAFCDYS